MALGGCPAEDSPDAGGSTGMAGSSTGDPTSGGPTGGPGTSSGEPTTTTANDTPGDLDTSSEGGSTSTGVVIPEDCSTFAQDCPPGYKCAPFANGGGSSWNDTMCVPVDDDPAGIGEPCVAEESGVSGFDDCDVGAFCFNVDADTLQGECIELCGGTPEEPVCEPDSTCIISSDGVLTPCLPNCDPLGDDCDENELCIPGGDSFLCAPDAAGKIPGGVGDPCEFPNVCDPGLGCFQPVDVVCSDPDSVGCCLPYCSLAAPDCPDMLTCLPFFEGEAPEGFEDVGICYVPE